MKYPLIKAPSWRLFIQKEFYQAIGMMAMSQLVLLVAALIPEYPKASIALNILVMALTLLTIIFAYKIIKTQDALDNKPKTINFSWKHYALSVLALVGYLYIQPVISSLFKIAQESQANQESINSMISAAPLAMFICVSIIAPICEELTFRLLLPKSFGNSIVVFIIMSILFTALHTPNGISGWMSYGLLAVILLSTRLLSDNITNSIATHISWNSFTFLLSILLIK